MVLGRCKRRLAVATAIGLCGVIVAGCSLPYQQLSLPSPVTPSASDGTGAASSKKASGVSLSGPGSSETREPRTFTGTAVFGEAADAGNPSSNPNPKSVGDGPIKGSPIATGAITVDGTTLNIVGASVPEVAKTVLGDIMGVNYTVSDKIKANITLRTARPVDKSALLAIFEAVLREEGAAIVVRDGLYSIVPITDAAAGGSPMISRNRLRQSPGTNTTVVPLRYVAATEMERILKSAAPQASVLRVDNARNLLMISGNQQELSSMSEMINVFDVDWMRGMSFGIFPVETADPEAISQELENIFSSNKEGPTKGVVRFIPNRRLKSVLVITSQPEYLRKAETWMKRIDLASKATEKQVNVYHVQHRPAAELATLLQKIYLTSGSGSGSTARSQSGISTTSDLAGSSSQMGSPGGGLMAPFGSAGGSGSLASSSATSSSGATAPATPVSQTEPPPAGSAASANRPPEGSSPQGGESGPSSGSPDKAGGMNQQLPDDRQSGISVVADEPKNSLVITATAAEFRRIKQVLARIDVPANQILLEATIAEVTLNDNLKFGVRWFAQNGASKNIAFNSVLGTGANAIQNLPLLAPTPAAGFSYFISMSNLQVTLNALSALTDVNIVSSPSLMVQENKRATLQVGDEVPIVTQQATGVQVPGAPILNSVSSRSTGVLLGITPRLGADGRVVLDIEQEVSDAVPTTTSTIDSPTIQQRRVKTTVTVNDGETIVLAGMMQDRATRNRDQLPILGDIPLVGNVFKAKDDSIKRTELLISITPQVLRDPRQIDAVASEYRDRLNFSTRPQRSGPPDRREQLDRLSR